MKNFWGKEPEPINSFWLSPEDKLPTATDYAAAEPFMAKHVEDDGAILPPRKTKKGK